jgi:hypothetical protein
VKKKHANGVWIYFLDEAMKPFNNNWATYSSVTI